jgi:hypothetical protein
MFYEFIVNFGRSGNGWMGRGWKNGGPHQVRHGGTASAAEQHFNRKNAKVL